MSSLTMLTGKDLYSVFIAGAKRLIQERAMLNSINVFPVPDGDTGTNMGYLMQTIVLEAKPYETVSETMESIANAAINGSRGNSGIIFSEYINGVFERLKGKVEVSVHDFSEAVSNGVRRAYQAMIVPVEGTILTVLRKAFEVPNLQSFHEFFADSLKRAKIALADTPNELKVLKDKGVVDAGAAGFTAFLEGIHHYFETGSVEETIQANEDVVLQLDTHDLTFEERYCTEGLILEPKKTIAELKELFQNEGSSLIVSGHSGRMRLHIHTDRPDRFFLKLKNVGTIVEQKVDDMKRQVDALQAHAKVAVVTDSIADIPSNLQDDLQVHLIPVNLLVDGVNYLDKVTLSSDTFYEILKDAKSVSSAAPSVKAIERSLDFLNDHYDDILVISVASKLSGTFNTFVQAAKNRPKVKVFDSRQNSGAQGILVYEASKMAKKGDSIDQIIARLDDLANRTKIFVSLDTLKYMIRQGRISKIKGLAAKVLNMKPIISLAKDGSGMIQDKAFSLKGTEKKILGLLAKRKLLSYAVVHAGAEERAIALGKQIESKFGMAPEYVSTISPIVAMNAGIGAVAVAAIFESWED